MKLALARQGLYRQTFGQMYTEKDVNYSILCKQDYLKLCLHHQTCWAEVDQTRGVVVGRDDVEGRRLTQEDQGRGLWSQSMKRN